MYEHSQKRIAYIAHPRTASSATGHMLLNMGFVIRRDHHAFDPEWNLDGWKVFCTVRNPLDVIVSWYYNKTRLESFDQWLPEFLEGCHYLQGPRMFFGRSSCTHVLHFETLQDDFDGLCNDVGLRPRTIERRNVSVRRENKGTMVHYNFDRARQVIKRFHDDFTENGYQLPSLRIT